LSRKLERDVMKELPYSSSDDVEALQLALDLLPLWPKTRRAYEAVRLWRIKIFLNGIDAVSESLNDEDRARFEQYINSKLGERLLADYADTVIRTRSETVIGALAILFSDAEHKLYPTDFKAAAALALEGLAERTIDGFLLILDQRANMRHRFTTNRNYVVYRLSNAEGFLPEAMKRWSSSGSEWIAIVNDLSARGLLLPDVIGDDSRPAENELWRCRFSLGSETEAYAALMRKARAFLRGSLETEK
jgi:hypothetical protein